MVVSWVTLVAITLALNSTIAEKYQTSKLASNFFGLAETSFFHRTTY